MPLGFGMYWKTDTAVSTSGMQAIGMTRHGKLRIRHVPLAERRGT